MAKYSKAGRARPPRRFKISPKLSVIRKPPTGIVVRPKPEGIRYLRSDASPNWSQRLARKSGELELYSTRPPITLTSTSTILDALEVLAKTKVRGLIITDAQGRLEGLLLAMDLVNYLGGGEYYNIVVKRHRLDLYSALNNEYVKSIMNPTPAYLLKTNSIIDAVKVMLYEGYGILPVLNEDYTVYGVVTEHDIVKALYEKSVGRRVDEISTKTIVSISEDEPLKSAGTLMVRHGFRRLPVISEGSIVGRISAKDYVSFFGSHEVFRYTSSRSIEEALSIPVSLVMDKDFYYIHEDADVGEAASVMIEHNTNFLIVVNDEGEATGIVTERDILVSLALEGG